MDSVPPQSSDSLLGRPLTAEEAARLRATPAQALRLSKTVLRAFAERGWQTALEVHQGCGLRAYGPIRGRFIRRAIQDVLFGEIAPESLGTAAPAEVRPRIEALLGRLEPRRQVLVRLKHGLWDGRRHDHHQLAAATSADFRTVHAELTAAHTDLKGLLRPRTDVFRDAVRSMYRTLLVAKQGMAGVHEWGDPASPLYEGQADAALGFAFLCRLGGLIPERLVALGLHGVCYDGPMTARRHDEAADAIKTALVNQDRPVSFDELRAWLKRIETSESFLRRCIAVSRDFGFMRSGMVGLRSAPYFDAHSVHEMAHAALTALRQPTHYDEIARTIDRLFPDRAPVNVQTVYHVLVVRKDSFVLARHGGIYGLAEWPERAVGSLKDFLSDYIRNHGGQASRQELMSAAREQGYKTASVSTILNSDRVLFTRVGWGKWALAASKAST
jgi:hypothetical protein